MKMCRHGSRVPEVAPAGKETSSDSEGVEGAMNLPRELVRRGDNLLCFGLHGNKTRNSLGQIRMRWKQTRNGES
jgi:hypothetical protein